MTADALLRVEGVSAGYGDMTVLHGVTFAAQAGTVTAVAGANGAGKTTLLKTILGLLPAGAGAVWFSGAPVTRCSVSDRIAQGMGLVPEGRGLFSTMSVGDNLRLGGRAAGVGGAALGAAIGEALELFPALSAKLKVPAGRLSGGQQQMLSLARTLVASPRLLLLDEPSMGLAPKVWSELLVLIRALAGEGRAVILAEQKIRPVLEISDHCVVLQRGRVVFTGAARDEAAERSISGAYLETEMVTGGDHG
ncbi:ABC transporter ATP-binding protein [Actinomadura macra]|uniref:ABC transporter ATP-binding protein n=1 Tax=Actinomadura macra TaxID=46164 RepID=UPI0009FD728A|nr:ABC transporter ATP-binding protein [Actinomadura macra]